MQKDGRKWLHARQRHSATSAVSVCSLRERYPDISKCPKEDLSQGSKRRKKGASLIRPFASYAPCESYVDNGMRL